MSEDNELKVGDRVQYMDWDSSFIYDGVLLEIIPAKRPKAADYWSSKYTEQEKEDMFAHAKVKWDDGTEEEVKLDDLAPRESELERTFRRTYLASRQQIEEKIAEAALLIQEAVRISEETGVPFSARVSPLRNSYFPRTTQDKFPDIDPQFVSDITETYNEYDSTGWRHSAVC